jgi:VanZ family protein
MRFLVAPFAAPLALIWALVILALSLTPGQEMPQVNFWEFDKFAHIGVYAVLGMLFAAAWTYRAQSKGVFMRSIMVRWTLLVPIIFGLSIEFVQGNFIPDRYFDVLDILANIIGSITGLVAFIVAMPTQFLDQISNP